MDLGSVGRANPTDPWSITLEVNPGSGMMDLGSVNAPPPLEHRDSGVGWSLQAASFKQQASSSKLLTAGPGYDRMDLERKTYD